MNERVKVIIVLSVLCLEVISGVLFVVFLINHRSTVQNNIPIKEIDIRNTSCDYSLHLNRNIFLHKCINAGRIVFDIRKFTKDSQPLKYMGIQLLEKEFELICSKCR